jgi:aspartate racemase
MQESVNIPIISIIDETVKISKNFKKPIILSSETTNKLKLYENKLKESYVAFFSVEEKIQLILNKIIKKMMSGNNCEQEIKIISKKVKELKSKGADSVILGCTELPLALNSKNLKIKTINTLEILANATIKEANLGEDKK